MGTVEINLKKVAAAVVSSCLVTFLLLLELILATVVAYSVTLIHVYH
jgi:hypothetical protein